MLVSSKSACAKSDFAVHSARAKTHSLAILLEALVMTLAAGAIGMLLSWGLTTAIDTAVLGRLRRRIRQM